MNHPLQKQVASVARRAWRMRMTFAAACWGAAALGAAIVAGVIDYAVRFEESGLRWMALCGVVAIAAWTAWRWIRPALSSRLTMVQAAHRIEARFPELSDRLSSTLDFLDQSEDDPRAGSVELRRAVAAETASLVDRLDMHQCLDGRQPRRAAYVLVGVTALLVGSWAVDPHGVLQAARRLAAPWRDDPWPRRHAIEFVDAPERIASGSAWEARVVDRQGRLPDDVRLLVRHVDGPAVEPVERPMKALGEHAVVRLENVVRPFEYRAVGGDHSNMPWRRMEVVEPPRLESVEIRVHAPAYTRLPVAPGGAHLRAYEQSRLSLTARTTKPVRRAVLVHANESGSAHVGRDNVESSGAATGPTQSAAIELEVGDDGRSIRLLPDAPKPWVVHGKQTYCIEITDSEGVVGHSDETWRVEPLVDQPPTVSIEEPMDSVSATAQGVVPIRLLVKDDLGVQRVELLYRRSSAVEGEPEQRITLYGPPSLPSATSAPPAANTNSAANSAAEAASSAGNSLPADPADDGAAIVGDDLEEGPSESRVIEFRWDLSRMTGLTPESSIEFRVAAEDFKPQRTETTPRRISILTPEAFEERLSQRQATILARLHEALQRQRDARTQQRAAHLELEESPSVEASNVDLVQAAELAQRQIAPLLSESPDSVRRLIAALQAELANNRMQHPEIERRMTELDAATAKIVSEPLPRIESGLGNAMKSARSALAGDTSAADARRAAIDELVPVGVLQDNVIAELERLAGDLSQWEDYRRFSRDVSRLRREQQDIQRRTGQLRLDTLTRPESAWQPAERVELRRLTEEQSELAGRFEKTLGRMEQMRVELDTSNPAAAATLGDAIEAARQAALGGQMREAGRNMEANRLGQAGELQEEIDRRLGEMLDTLSNRREHQLDRMARGLTEAARDLDGLRQRQGELADQANAAAQESDPAARRRALERLVREQEQLERETRELGRRLERLQAERAAPPVDRAAESMQQAGSHGEQGDAGAAEEAARQAERDLEEAQAEVARAVQQAQRDLMNEQMARLEQTIAGLIARQQTIVDETARLAGLLDTQGELTRAQQASVGLLAGEQRTLAEEVDGISSQVKGAEAFTLGLSGAVREMHRAASLLDRVQIGVETQQAEQIALARLQQVAEALKDDASSASDDSGGQSQGDQNSPGAESIRALAELKLIKLMQEEINRRTSELEEVRRRAGELNDGQLRELQDLAVEQGELADLLRRLAKTAAGPTNAPSDLPDAIPDPLDNPLPDDLPNLLPGLKDAPDQNTTKDAGATSDR